MRPQAPTSDWFPVTRLRVVHGRSFLSVRFVNFRIRGWRAGLHWLLITLVSCGVCGGALLDIQAAERVGVTVLVSDAMARSTRSVRIESRVVTDGLLGSRGVGGERVGLWVDGTQVATGLTGGDGRAYFEFEPRRIGLHPMKVTLAGSPRVQDAEGRGTLAVWERRRPLLLVEQGVLESGPTPPDRGVPFPPGAVSGPQRGEPAPGAAEELARLTKFYYNLIYLVPVDQNGMALAQEVRTWLKSHGFPPGVVLTTPRTAAGIEEFIARLKDDGWDNLRAGVGTSRVFAQALVAQRMIVAIRTERAREEFPRKARVVKDWKAVRKQLQE